MKEFTEKINKIETNLGKTLTNADNIAIFISIKQASNQIKTFEEPLKRLEKENIIKHYKFDPEKKLKAMLNELKHLNVFNDLNLQPLKTPVHFKDIDITTAAKESIQVRGTVMLQNWQILQSTHHQGWINCSIGPKEPVFQWPWVKVLCGP